VRVAHALRRELIRTGHPDALAGTRFMAPAAAAAAVLDAAGIHHRAGEEHLRTARLRALFLTDLPLAHFNPGLLRSRPGWDEAFAHTIGDLERAGLEPEDVERVDAPGVDAVRLRDVAAIWRGAARSAGESWSTARIYREAARALEHNPSLWPFPGPTLAAAGGDTAAAEARFLRAIPDARLALLAARPTRDHHITRMEALFGRPVADALARGTAPRTIGTERDLVASYLFEPPAVLADPSRPRSGGPDGTVALEEHAGVEAEVEAAADWVARQVLEGTPLEEIAVLVPALDPLAGIVADRIAQLPWHEATLPVHVAGGLPLSRTAAGARALAVVRALRAHLAAESLAGVLPVLRADPPDSRHLSSGAATTLAWSLGTVGGNPAHPAGALEWARRAVDREGELEAQLARAREAADDPEKSGLARSARDLERTLADLRAIRPALLALVEVARLVAGAATLAILWPALRAFLEGWLLQPGEGPRVESHLREQMDRTASDPACGDLTGDDGLRVIEDVVGSTRLPVGRFGEPAIYIGTVAGAVGLPFEAVRVIGLAEGHLPTVPREDPVIPDRLRARLAERGAPPTAADRALAALHALDRVIRDTRSRLVLSAPRLDIERSLREPSSVLLEAAAALGRPNAATGAPGPIIPDGVALRRDSFTPARAAARAFRRLNPVGEVAWQDGLATSALGLPAAWCGSLALDLERIRSLRAPAAPAALDGFLGPSAAGVPVPGLTPERPISPSALRDLLQCPHLYLLGTLLHLDEPPGAPPQREIGQPAYGSLVHRAAEEFYRNHGAAFGARQDSLDAWLGRADAVVERVFPEFLQQYPLVGGAVAGKERERFRQDLRELLEHDWNRGVPRQFVAVERSFGRPDPVALPAGRLVLHTRGQIDRLDVEDGLTLVRDLKTGRAHPRTGKEVDPDPVRDIQIGVYGLVARELAARWQVPPQVAAAYTFVGRGAEERSWRHDFEKVLEPAVRQWLALGAGLLAGRAFPRTPNAGDCTYCRFRPVCGDDAPDRAAEVLRDATGALAAFRAMKGPGDDD
jgi:hypothetical protein